MEDLKNLYEYDSLDEQLDNDIYDLFMLTESNDELYDSLDILHEALMLEWETGTGGNNNEKPNEKPGNNNDEDGEDGNNRKPKNKDKEKDPFEKALDNYDRIDKALQSRIQRDYQTNDRIPNVLDKGRSEVPYAPVASQVVVEKYKDLPFPQNIIKFIQAIVTWIKNNILNFIDKFSNIVRSLLGMDAGRSRFTADQLKLKFEDAKVIESKALLNYGKVYNDKAQIRFSDKLNGRYSEAIRNDNYVVRPITVPFNDVNIIQGTLTEANEIERHSEPKEQVVIMIDTSKDLFALKQTLEHFFDLFDNAYGSNDEKLFSVDDLQIMLQVFNDTYNSMFNISKVSAVEISGDLSFGGGIDSGKLKDNLIRTKINTDNLKAAYVMTNKQITTISKIIMNKNLASVGSLGSGYAFLSASTYETMIDIIKVVDERLKEASKMEKKLQKMKSAYDNLVKTLESKRTKLKSVSGIAINYAIERKIDNLYDSARYMSQTVQLRLSTLALYISELNDTRIVLKNINALADNMITSKGMKFFKRLKSAF